MFSGQLIPNSIHLYVPGNIISVSFGDLFQRIVSIDHTQLHSAIQSILVFTSDSYMIANTLDGGYLLVGQGTSVQRLEILHYLADVG